KLARRGIVLAMLAHHLPDALHDAAMELALEQRLVEHAAAVVCRRIAQDVDLAGVGVDLDLGDMRSARIGARRGNLGERIEGGVRYGGVAPCQLLYGDREVRPLN